MQKIQKNRARRHLANMWENFAGLQDIVDELNEEAGEDRTEEWNDTLDEFTAVVEGIEDAWNEANDWIGPLDLPLAMK